MSIEKARNLLGYTPAHSSISAVREALDWLIADGQVRV
jgi:nucleoside-diphosphate-sugar epimerase